MDNTTSEHNKVFDSPVLSAIQSTGKLCSGKECPKSAKNCLEILFINKRGYFCEECTRDLLAKKLAVSVQESDQS